MKVNDEMSQIEKANKSGAFLRLSFAGVIASTKCFSKPFSRVISQTCVLQCLFIAIWMIKCYFCCGMEAKNRNIRGLITITVWITSFFQAMESINIEELMSIRFLDWTICDTFKSMGKKAACKHSGRSRIALNIVIQVKIFPLKDSVSACPAMCTL